MGILADLFVSTPEEAIAYEAAIGTAQIEKRYERAEYKGLTGLEFGTLWAILEGKEWDVDKHMLEEIHFGPDGETWLMKFPAELIGLLISADAAKTEAALNSWAQTEELQMNGVTLEDVRPIFTDLVRLANIANTEQESLYLWGSL